jgi:ring-1,2-phenylacetyl-CoA epoxidase subunit PaaD
VSGNRAVWDAAAQVADPEIPVLTLADMGVLRSATVTDDGVAHVEITPTYCGCPAMDAMATDIKTAVRAAGFDQVEVSLVWSPAWSTDWMSASGRAKLAAYGIAPPRGRSPKDGAGPGQAADAGHSPTSLTLRSSPIRCPQCGSTATHLVSRFGSTACKALRQCDACGEPFDHFKEL